MIDVLVEKVTGRVVYTLDFIFKARGISYQLVTDQQVFDNSDNLKFSYLSRERSEVNIHAASLLFEEGIQKHAVSKASFDGMECMSFNDYADPIASIFYTLVRYEEYVVSERDSHGRFAFASSCLKEYGWIEKAMCDRWAESVLKFAGVLNENILREVKLVPTFDIDNTYAYKFKSGKRRTLSVLRDWLKLDFARIKERKFVEGGGKDPYDSFDEIAVISKKFPEAYVFWLVGELAEKDRNLSISIQEHQQLIKRIASSASLGLHPSYASNGEASMIETERERLEGVINKKVIASRQHFLRFQIDKTYANLVKAGIEHEYSMGFAESVGFRSGTARPHQWYDLMNECVTDLVVHPFVYMDGTLNEYMELSVQESKARISALYDEVKTYGGDFVFIWHNETIGDYGRWKGWNEVLDHTLNLGNE